MNSINKSSSRLDTLEEGIVNSINRDLKRNNPEQKLREKNRKCRSWGGGKHKINEGHGKMA